MGSFADSILFTPTRIAGLDLPNRIAMAPMTRALSPGGVPAEGVAAYYRRRAEGGAGLIISEGVWIDDPHASNEKNVPRFHGEDALTAWAEVLHAVHGAGARMIPQLWHTGINDKPDVKGLYDEVRDEQAQIGPSGLLRAGRPQGEAMTIRQAEAIQEAYAAAAEDAFRLGFDGVELHGAHGYLFDQFFWNETNVRDDRFGGDIAGRTRFAAETIRAIRARTSPDFPIILRISQFKLVDYTARLASTPQELEQFLAPLVDAGVDAFHCSQRRFWDAEFPGSPLNLAGWAKKLTGKATITVGSVTLDVDMFASLLDGKAAEATGLGELVARMERGEFDMVAVGRAMLSNPDWSNKVRDGRVGDLKPFTPEVLTSLV